MGSRSSCWMTSLGSGSLCCAPPLSIAGSDLALRIIDCIRMDDVGVG